VDAAQTHRTRSAVDRDAQWHVLRHLLIRGVALPVALALIPVMSMATTAAADSSSGSGEIDLTTSTTRPPATPKSTSELRAAAIAWARVFLTGTLHELRSMQGPECRPATTRSTLPLSVQDAYFRALRLSMRHYAGRALSKIRILDVEMRNVTATRGEAQVVYDLPISKVGNDNWVEFTVHRGRWLVSDCKAPIGGNSSASTDSSASVATSTP
jgi:hypothetical protein